MSVCVSPFVSVRLYVCLSISGLSVCLLVCLSRRIAWHSRQANYISVYTRRNPDEKTDAIFHGTTHYVDSPARRDQLDHLSPAGEAILLLPTSLCACAVAVCRGACVQLQRSTPTHYSSTTGLYSSRKSFASLTGNKMTSYFIAADTRIVFLWWSYDAIWSHYYYYYYCCCYYYYYFY